MLSKDPFVCAEWFCMDGGSGSRDRVCYHSYYSTNSGGMQGADFFGEKKLGSYCNPWKNML